MEDLGGGKDVIFISYEDVQNWICFSSLGIIISLVTLLYEEHSWPSESPCGLLRASLTAQGHTVGLYFSFYGINQKKIIPYVETLPPQALPHPR